MKRLRNENRKLHQALEAIHRDALLLANYSNEVIKNRISRTTNTEIAEDPEAIYHHGYNSGLLASARLFKSLSDLKQLDSEKFGNVDSDTRQP